MEIITLTLGALATNCYLAVSKSKGAVIIDPADDADAIRRRLESDKLTPKAILLTHGHYDHIMAAHALAEAYHTPVYVHINDKLKLSSRTENLHAYFCVDEPFEEIQRPCVLSDGDSVAVDELTFQVLHTPGHTRGSVCYLCGGVIFTGDTLFEGSVGRTDMPDGDYATLVQSLKKLSGLSGEYTLYPGHGNQTTLQSEKQNNIFMTDIDGIF